MKKILSVVMIFIAFCGCRDVRADNGCWKIFGVVMAAAGLYEGYQFGVHEIAIQKGTEAYDWLLWKIGKKNINVGEAVAVQIDSNQDDEKVSSGEFGEAEEGCCDNEPKTVILRVVDHGGETSAYGLRGAISKARVAWKNSKARRVMKEKTGL